MVHRISAFVLVLAACGGSADVAGGEDLGEHEPDPVTLPPAPTVVVPPLSSSSSCSVAADCPRPPPSPEDSPTVDVSDCDRAVCSEHECHYSFVVNGAFDSPWTGAHVTCVDGRVWTLSMGSWKH